MQLLLYMHQQMHTCGVTQLALNERTNCIGVMFKITERVSHYFWCTIFSIQTRGKLTLDNTNLVHLWFLAFARAKNAVETLWSPVSWDCGEVNAPTSVPDMTLNHLMLRLLSWSFGERCVRFHCHYSQILGVLGFHIWNKQNCLTI